MHIYFITLCYNNLCTQYKFVMWYYAYLFLSDQVRVPFSSFRAVNPEDPPLDPFLVHTLTIRFEPRRQVRFEASHFLFLDLLFFFSQVKVNIII